MDAILNRADGSHSPEIKTKFRDILTVQKEKKGLRKKGRKHSNSNAMDISSKFSSTFTAYETGQAVGKLPTIVSKN